MLVKIWLQDCTALHIILIDRSQIMSDGINHIYSAITWNLNLQNNPPKTLEIHENTRLNEIQGSVVQN